jgi:predicted nucleic acid-binding protein
MTSTLIDSNVMIDIFAPRQANRDWALDAVTTQRSIGKLYINQIIVSELACLFPFQALLRALGEIEVGTEQLGLEAAWHAGVAHGAYRRAGGARERTLPDFLIGAQAALARHTLLTRDAKRYRSYFPDLKIIAPDTHP